MRIGSLIALAASLVALQAVNTATAKPSTQRGAHFHIICDFENDTIASEALKTAEAVWPVAAQLLAVDDSAPAEPLKIYLYRTVGAYERVAQELAGGRFRRNQAFSHWDSHSAHIVLQPLCSDEALAQIGLPSVTRRLIAHEATHLMRYATMPNFRSHPDWLADGVATYVEQKVMQAGGWSQAPAEDPFAATMVSDAARQLASGALTAADILRDRLDAVDWRTRYALRWLLLDYLVQSSDSVPAIMRTARRLGGGDDYTSRLMTFVESTLGPETMAGIDERFKTYVNAINPQWHEVYRALDTRGSPWTQVAFPDTNAICWRTAPVGRDSYTLSGFFKVLPGAGKQMNLLLGRNADGFVSVALVPESGITVFNYHAREDRWERLGHRDAAIKMNDWNAVEITVTPPGLKARVDDAELSVELNGRSMVGPWGLGTQAGTAGQWRHVTLK